MRYTNRPTRKIRFEPMVHSGAPGNPRLARPVGYSLHATTICEAHQADRMELLCLCVTRPQTRRTEMVRLGEPVDELTQAMRLWPN